MTDSRLDVLCIGNAIVDVIADAERRFLHAEGLTKGSMRLIDAEEAERLYSHMGPAHQVSGGSAGNTAAGVAALGGRAGFIGQVAPDQLGDFYRHDLTATGVEFITPRGRRRSADGAIDDPGDARRPSDDEHLPRRGPASARKRARRRADPRCAAILYLEGYLWDPETPRQAMVRAIEVAHEAGRKVAFTLSDIFCVDRHRDGFNELLDARRIDILFANQAEVEALAGVAHLEDAVAAVRAEGRDAGGHPQRGRRAGARGSERADVPPSRSTSWSTRPAPATCSLPASCSARRAGTSLERSLRIGAIAAAEVIQHYGARPEADLRALADELLA